jgi:hypothetical protein
MRLTDIGMDMVILPRHGALDRLRSRSRLSPMGGHDGCDDAAHCQSGDFFRGQPHPERALCVRNWQSGVGRAKAIWHFVQLIRIQRVTPQVPGRA